MADPGNMQVIEELRSMTGLEIRPAVGIPDEIRRAINLHYRVSSEIEREVGRALPAQPSLRRRRNARTRTSTCSWARHPSCAPST